MGKKRAIVIAILAIILILLFVAVGFFTRYNTTTEQSTYSKYFEFNGKKYQKKTNIETLLLLGTDKYADDGESEYFKGNGQADFIMLAVLDKSANKCYGIQINRDTMTDVRVLGVGGKVIKTEQMQIALSHAYGTGGKDSCLNTIRSVSTVLNNTTVDHYIAISMDAIPYINDYVGGVTVEIMDDFTDIDKDMVQGETVTLKGEQSLSYIRERLKLDDKTNIHRMERQRQYFDAFMKQYNSKNLSGNDLSKMFEELTDSLTTDYSVSGLQTLAENIKNYTFESIESLPGELKEGEEYMEFYPDANGVTELVLSLLYNEQ